MAQSLLAVVTAYSLYVAWKASDLRGQTRGAAPWSAALTIVMAQLHRRVILLGAGLSVANGLGILADALPAIPGVVLNSDRADLWAAVLTVLWTAGALVYAGQARRHIQAYLPDAMRAEQLRRLPTATWVVVGALTLYLPTTWGISALNYALPGETHIETAEMAAIETVMPGDREALLRARARLFEITVGIPAAGLVGLHAEAPPQLGALHIKDGALYSMVTHVQLDAGAPQPARMPAGRDTELRQAGPGPKMAPRQWLPF